MQTRDSIAQTQYTPEAAEDHSGKVGYALKKGATTAGAMSLCDANDDEAVAIITEIDATTGKYYMIPLGGPPVRAKLGGTVAMYDKLCPHTDGRWVKDPGTGDRAVGPVALAAGVANDLVEVIPNPVDLRA